MNKNRTQGSRLSKLTNYLFGYDFFISYAWSDGGSYAQALAEALEQDGFECFLDREDFAKGQDWKRAGIQALRNTHRLILLATPDALRSEPVSIELDNFRGHDKKVIPINFGGVLNEEDGQSKVFRYISSDYLWIDESPIAPNLVPSKTVLADIKNSLQRDRQSTIRLKWITRAAAAMLLVSIAAVGAMLFAFYQSHIAEHNRDQAVRALEQVVLTFRQPVDVGSEIIKGIEEGDVAHVETQVSQLEGSPYATSAEVRALVDEIATWKSNRLNESEDRQDESATEPIKQTVLKLATLCRQAWESERATLSEEIDPVLIRTLDQFVLEPPYRNVVEVLEEIADAGKVSRQNLIQFERFYHSDLVFIETDLVARTMVDIRPDMHAGKLEKLSSRIEILKTEIGKKLKAL